MNELNTQDLDIRTGIKAGEGDSGGYLGSGNVVDSGSQMGTGSKTNGQMGSGY